MRITESQLRRVIKRMLKEQADSNLPQVGDHFEPAPESAGFVTDQAKDASGKGYFLQRKWVPGDVVEVVNVRPSSEFAFGRGMQRAPDVDDRFMSKKAGAGMPTQPLKGTTNSYRVEFKALGPPVKPMVDLFTKEPQPQPNPDDTYSMEVTRFLNQFKPA